MLSTGNPSTGGWAQLDTDLQQIAKSLNRLIEQTSLSIVVPITQGGTGATTAAGARTNLGIGTIGTQDADAVDLTGGTIDGVPIGQTAAAPVTATTLINAGAEADQSADYHQPVTGFAITVPNACSWLNLDPSGMLAVGTVLMCVSPIDGQLVAISSSQIISSFSVMPNGSQTLNGGPTTFAANTSMWWRYRAANLRWYRLL